MAHNSNRRVLKQTTYKKVIYLGVRISMAERLALQKQAEAEGLTLSNLVRHRLFGSK